MFYLGTHHPNWLALTDTPLFVSHRTIGRMRSLPRAMGPWSLDSGGFSELSLFGRWETSSSSYVAAVRRLRSEVGNMNWAAIQDWMCEPHMLKLTGKTVAQHQALTVASYLELRSMAPEVPWLPVIQGWTRGDYIDCVELYARAGIDLTSEPIVGIGSVCRRQGTVTAALTIRWLASDGLKLHGFGFKVLGLSKVKDALASSDSMAWSVDGRRSPPLPGHDLPGPRRPKGHKNCANCLDYALEWRRGLVERGIITA